MANIKKTVKAGKAGLRMLSGKKKYKIKQNMLNLTGDYKITDSNNKVVFVVDAALLSLRKSLVFKDKKGNEVCSIKEPMATMAEDLKIEDADGKNVATVKRRGKKIETAKYSVNFRGAPDVNVEGDVPGKDFKMRFDGDVIANVNKSMFTVADSYGAEVEHGEDDALVLAAIVSLDILSGGGGGGATDMVQGAVSKGVTGVAKQGVKSVTKGATKKK